MRGIRISIAIIVSFLIFSGIVMIYSSSGIYAMQELGDSLYFLKRHLLFLLIGLVMTLIVMAIDYRDLQKFAKPMMLMGLAMLVLVLVPGLGKTSFGAQRWFKIGPFFIQPSEFVKIAVLIYTADFLARKQNRILSFWYGFVPIMTVLGAVSVLIIKQPDLGSTVLIGLVVVVMIFIAGARMRHLGTLMLMALPAFYLFVYRVPYRWRRIITFLDPWKDPSDAGFQLTQSQIAFGNGGIFGVGLGQSVQKLFYLPAAHTDFVLSIVGEELGFTGTLVIVLLFMLLVVQGLRIAKRANDSFGYFLCIGVITMIGIQASLNIGVSTGALPTKGLPLPFISYGGSALITSMIMIGLLLNVSRTSELEN
ncbi:MAG: putative lipid II flippase FtsW [Candidatus Omnitrophota bacterium]